jgi:hypothetical protein
MERRKCLPARKLGEPQHCIHYTQVRALTAGPSVPSLLPSLTRHVGINHRRRNIMSQAVAGRLLGESCLDHGCAHGPPHGRLVEMVLAQLEWDRES